MFFLVEWLWGVGVVMVEKLYWYGICMVGELVEFEVVMVERMLGKVMGVYVYVFVWLWDLWLVDIICCCGLIGL